MKRILLAVIVLIAVWITLGDTATRADAPLDISAITAVAISGEASSVDITTAPDQPYQASLTRHREGWFARWNSIWSYDDCSDSSRMRIEGSLLRIDAGLSAWFGMSDCRYEIRLNVRKDIAVAIHQQALSTRLSGEFSAVTIDAKAADIAISGHAGTIALNSDALRVNIVLTATGQPEAVTVNARMLEADLDFAAAPALAYSVTGKASFVDAARPSVPGAPVSLAITSEFVHATIR